MRSCTACRKDFLLYADKEPDLQNSDEFYAHLRECEICREDFKAEEELSALLYQSRPLYLAPDTLRERIMRANVQSPPLTSRSPAHFNESGSTVLPGSFRAGSRYTWLWGALAAVFLLVFVGLLFATRTVQRSSANSYIEAAIVAHREILNGSLPIQVQSALPNVVTAWFAGKVPFNFRLPSSAETSGLESAYELVGGRILDYKGTNVALVVYQMRKEKISLLIAPGKSAATAGGEEILSHGMLFHYNKRAGLNIITWSNHGLTYALVSSLLGSGSQSCLVCHQNIGTGRHS